MDEHTPALTWFEVPADDFERACRFYETILDAPLKRDAMEGDLMGVFPGGEAGVGGCVFHGPHATRPAENGSVVYLNCSGKLDAVVGRVAAAGGAVLMPPTPLDRGLGRIAVIRDSEGNRVGLHAFAG